MSEVKVDKSGSGLPLVLFITFLVLKLTEVIDWSWWWVTAPLWIGAAVFVLMTVLIGTIVAVSSIAENRKSKASIDHIRSRMR